MRVAIYIRVSTKMQEEKYSLPAQRLELTRYAESMGWTIVGVFEDADSGTKLEKDGLVSMLSVVQDGLVDVVLFIEQDRLSRLDTVAWEYLKDILRENNVKIAEPGVLSDLSDSKDEFFSDLKNLLARQARADLLQKMMRGKRQRTREGKVWGRQPEEYHYDKNTEIISINEERAWIIPFIDKLYLQMKMSTTAIAKELNKRTKTVEGKKWTDAQVHQKLTRKAYHGMLVKKFKGETIEKDDVYPPLRTEETYELIQENLKSRSIRRASTPHILRDITFKCAACNRLLSVKKTISYGKKEGQRYESAVITHLHDVTRNNCSTNPYINTKRIEKQLEVAVKDIIANPNKAQQYIDSGFDEGELSSLQKDIERLQKRKESNESQINKILDLYLDGSWNKDRLDQKRDELEGELKQIEKDLSESKRKRVLIQNNQINYDTISEFLSVAARYEKLLDVSDQQMLIGSLFPAATVDAKNSLLILHAALPEDVSVDINIQIEPMEEVQEREMLAAAKIRYDHAQSYLNEHKGTSLEALCRVLGSQPPTLKLDQERFGPFQHLARPRNCPDLRLERIEILKDALAKHPKIGGRKLEEITGINRKMIYKLIKEEGLR